MTPPMPLIDTQLERMFVAALIASPADHDLVDVGVADLADFQARAAYEAFGNARGRASAPSMADICDDLQKRHDQRGPHRPGEETLGDQDLRWFTSLASMPLPTDPPIAMWGGQLIALSEARRAALADAEPVQLPRKNPTGPRAVNAEPVRLAEAFRRYLYERNDEPTLVRWARAWWRYEGTHFVEHDDELLDRDLIKFLDVAVVPRRDQKTGVTHHERVTSKNKTIAEVRKSCLHVFPIVGSGAPQWTSHVDGDPAAADLAPCANGLLNVKTRELLPSTARLFATTALGSAWDPAAEAPIWKSFLASLWDDDAESIRALQQMFGYLLTPDTSHQKMFLIQGPPRCGKGTIARVLRALLSPDAVAHPTLASLEETFGLEPVIGKTLATIGDARLGGNAADQSAIVERLLSMSGEDAINVNRKNRSAIDVRLHARVLLLTNELPRLYDTSGALASRFVILCLTRSFLGEEDTMLEWKLLAELPGILRWAVDGHEDLQEQGRFAVPASSAVAVAHMKAISSPLTVFLDDCCEVSPSREVPIDTLWGRYQEWCKSNGHDRPGNKQWFGRNLNTLHPEIEQTRPTLPTGDRVRVYLGIGLR